MLAHQKEFETLLVKHCACVLQNLKVANMFHIPCFKFSNLKELVDLYNKKLHRFHLSIRLFYTGKKRVTIYLYQEDYLSSLLNHTQIHSFLCQYDYPLDHLDHTLDHLEYRLNQYEEYPHEIGLFLGYPLCDVLGFIHHQKCQYCGYWKVYKNVQDSYHLFCQFDQCIKQINDEYSQGKTIEQLIIC
ncbi:MULTISPECIES: DUF3793 family protein [Coprobacillaceae]|uniref:DUF3793 family protein n=1 Tax=Coprobacillaceae TaxID=2810280 RepID=UPI000E4A05F7|nr:MULTISPECIES: DUF3793 family protein [Coprobacillaceae]RHM61510.1 DUF3793 family protein [Coprobacillus sp. AF33-1AC]RHS93945.1 DUF3793 family protein [Erysipelatoclostridium sp. AM42-17]